MAGALGVVLFVFGATLAPATMSASSGTDTTITVPTDATTSTTLLPTTTTPLPTTTSTLTVTTTAPPTTAVPTTTTAPPTTTHAAAPAPVPTAGVRERSLSLGCPVVAVVLLLPGRAPLLVGAFAKASAERAGIERLSYRGGGGIVTGLGATMNEAACTASGVSGARVSLSSLSLLLGTVTADRVTLSRGDSVTTAVSGLEVAGAPVSTSTGRRIPVPGVGYLTTGTDARVHVSKGTVAAAALALHLTSPHAGLPAGTDVLVAAIGLPRTTPKPHHAAKPKRTHRHKHEPTGRPLTITPRLALRHYDFPVAGPASYGDSYGGLRTDVPGHWHHGDDIFAALGTPVVAVSDGTINRVGWERLGGWRLWVRDAAGDQFYYAHLSGYAPHDLHSNRVKAGQVIGFVGNTGDAYTTSPHLHFEIHPRGLLHLKYNGAVDPTTYLATWTHLDHVDAPRPVHPPLPAEPTLRTEAQAVFRQLLVARHLVPRKSSARTPKPAAPSAKVAPAEHADTNRLAATTHAAPDSSTPVVLVVALIAALVVAAGIALLVRRRGVAP